MKKYICKECHILYSEQETYKEKNICPQCLGKIIQIENNSLYYNEIENMMLNLIEEGQIKVWQSIEEIKNPLERCKQRKIYSIAIKKIIKK